MMFVLPNEEPIDDGLFEKQAKLLERITAFILSSPSDAIVDMVYAEEVRVKY